MTAGGSRGRRRAAWIVAWLVVATTAACGKGSSTTTGLNGRFRAQTPQGAQDIVLAQSGSEVKVTMNGEDVTGRVVSPGRVEGSKGSEEGTLWFVLLLEGADRLRARFAIQPAGGERTDLPEATFERVVEAPSGGGSGGGGETALVGHWRHTDILGEGGSDRLVTDTHLVFEAGGRYATWSKWAGGGSSGESERTEGTWKVERGVLRLRLDGGDWEEAGRYEAPRLVITSGGAPRVFERL